MDRFVLPPGFRFHPTDEELLSHYLRRKVCGRKFDIDAIAEVDLYNYEPWDLPDKSFLHTRDLEWYFFIPRDRKYPNGSRTNRATEKGYWKSTGKDRYISSGSRVVGTKKTLVYYNGRAPKGERTNWVMHEYRLNDAECQRVNARENCFVLCRIYQKSGAGPKNGEQYGAPVEDEEFDGLSSAEGDGSGSFKDRLLGAGPSNANGHYDCSPLAEDNKVHPQFTNAGIQPRNLKFEDSPGISTSDLSQMENVTNVGGSRSIVLPGPDCPGEDFNAPAGLEEDILWQDLCEAVKPNAFVDQLESADSKGGPITYSETGFCQSDARPPNDGDFLELNDLLSVSDCEDGIEALRSGYKQTNGEWTNFSNESECTSATQFQAVPTFRNMPHDHSGQWQDLSFGDGLHEKLQNLPESVQMQSSMSAVTDDFQDQPFKDSFEYLIASSDLYNEELGIACQTDSREPDFEEVLELFERAKEDKSFNVESFAENMRKELLQSEDIGILPSQDGLYYDALLSLPDMGMFGETRSSNMHNASNFGANPMTYTQAALESEVDELLDNLAVDRSDRIELPDGGVAESGVSLQGEVINSGQAKPPLSPYNLLMSCLDSLPTLPASAADLSPKALSPEIINAGRFVRSFSLSRQRIKPPEKGRIRYYVIAVLGVLLAVFWMLAAAGGAGKLFGGIYTKMVGSETT